jgi:hypothetical protein
MMMVVDIGNDPTISLIAKQHMLLGFASLAQCLLSYDKSM